ncbi:MAG: hypothetical protein A2Z18_01655 [Armatimonadetes bacterium RBG_16_58_9]|nr:MAG: hypothetical protein A2Z18_01655 [Armatimonadetes bacterium RBG_16_58_9]
MSPRPVRPRSYLIPLALSIGCLPWLILGLVVLVAAFRGAGEQHGEHVALIRINGLITAGSSGSSLFDGNVSGSEDVVEQLEKARESSSVKAVVIRINSPGGSPAGSEEIYRAIRRVRNSGKVVYASMGDVAASGGYYIAAPCNKIYSDASTITGSIGVIFETADLSSLFKKIGMNPETIKSGKYKDIGSPNRPLTSEERKLLQGIVDDTYATFVRAVSDGRKMSIVDVKKIADGRVFTGAQARKIKLVDEIGGQYETVRAAAVAGGIKGKPKVVEYRKAGWLESVLGGSGARAADEALRRELADRLLRGGQSQTLPR